MKNGTRTICMAAVCTASLALAADATHPAAAGKPEAPAFHPHKATNESQDKKELEALVKADQEAMKTADVNAMAALVDFPVQMATDDSKGEASAVTWDKAQWVSVMTESMKNMPKDTKMSHKFSYDILTDSLAIVRDDVSTTMGKTKVTWKSASLVIKKNGKWMWKSMIEGGWGDGMKTSGTGSAGTAGTQPTTP